MNIAARYVNILRNLRHYDQRLPRIDFWLFVSFNALIAFSISGISIYINSVALLFLVVTTLLAASKRLADVGISKTYLLLLLIPVIGPFFITVWLMMAGHPADNRFGPYRG